MKTKKESQKQMLNLSVHLFFFQRRQVAVAAVVFAHELKHVYQALERANGASLNARVHILKQHGLIYGAKADQGVNDAAAWALGSAFKGLQLRQDNAGVPLQFTTWLFGLRGQEKSLTERVLKEARGYAVLSKYPNQKERTRVQIIPYPLWLSEADHPILRLLSDMAHRVEREYRATGSIQNSTLGWFVDDWNNFPAFYHKHGKAKCGCLACTAPAKQAPIYPPFFPGQVGESPAFLLVASALGRPEPYARTWPHRQQGVTLVTVGVRISEPMLHRFLFEQEGDSLVHYLKNGPDFWQLKHAAAGVLRSRDLTMYARITQDVAENPAEKLFHEVHNHNKALYRAGLDPEPYVIPVTISNWEMPQPSGNHFTLHPTTVLRSNGTLARFLQHFADRIADIYAKGDVSWMKHLLPLFQDPDFPTRYHIVHRSPRFATCSCPVCQLHRGTRGKADENRPASWLGLVE